MAKFFLVGYMGSGKTTIGKQLASKLNYEFIDLDAFIEREYQETIDAVFETKGEGEFRAMEHNMLKKVVEKNNVVVACGGGTPCYYGNMDLMNNNGITIYVKMSADTLISRLVNAKSSRPLLKDKTDEELRTFISQQLEKREDFYHQAHYVVKGKDLNVTELAKFLKEQVGV